jgi:transcription antitermination factor NusG
VNLTGYDNCWCAIQVIPRREVVVSTILRRKGYEEFLPMHGVRRQWSDRSKVIQTPLFTGYVFCKLNSGIPWSIVTTAGVVRIVGTQKEISVIDDQEIQAIKLAVKAGVKVEPCAYAKIGDRVRITSGPMCGVEGIVTGYKRQQRLVLSLDLIQSSISVETEGWNLAPVTPAVPVAPPTQTPVTQLLSAPEQMPHAG